MFGLRNCKEEYFNYFKGSNERYFSNSATIIGGILICNLILLGLSFIIGLCANVKYSTFIGYLIAILIVMYLSVLFLSKNSSKKAESQKFITFCEVINYFIFSIASYTLPMVYISLNRLYNIGLKIFIFVILLGFIYLIYSIVRLCKEIKKGHTVSEDCREVVYGKLFSKIAYLSFSIPVIVVFSRVVRRISITMDRTGNNYGILILMLSIALMIQVVASIFIPEGLVLIYCKFRFDSFTIKCTEASKPFVNTNKNKGFKQVKKKRKNH